MVAYQQEPPLRGKLLHTGSMNLHMKKRQCKISAKIQHLPITGIFYLRSIQINSGTPQIQNTQKQQNLCDPKTEEKHRELPQPVQTLKRAQSISKSQRTHHRKHSDYIHQQSKAPLKTAPGPKAPGKNITIIPKYRENAIGGQCPFLEEFVYPPILPIFARFCWLRTTT